MNSLKIIIFSLGYRFVRWSALRVVYLYQIVKKEPRDLELAIEWGDRQLSHLRKMPLAKCLEGFSIPKGIGVDVYDLHFPSPLLVSSFKDDWGQVSSWLAMGAGGAILKTILAEPRSGNPRPRIQEVVYHGQYGLLNAMGLPGKGLVVFLEQLEGAWQSFPIDRPLGISIGGRSLAEYQAVFTTLHEQLEQWPSRPFFMNLILVVQIPRKGKI